MKSKKNIYVSIFQTPIKMTKKTMEVEGFVPIFPTPIVLPLFFVSIDHIFKSKLNSGFKPNASLIPEIRLKTSNY